MGEQNRRMVDGATNPAAPSEARGGLAGGPPAAPRAPTSPTKPEDPPPAAPGDSQLARDIHDEAQTRRMAPDDASPGEGAGD